MKKLLFLLIIPLLSFGQKKYQKNNHVYINTDETRKNYEVEYDFKNHMNESQGLIIPFNKKLSDTDIKKFGIPEWMFDSYTVTPQVKRERAQILRDGLYKKVGNRLERDYSAIVNYYRGSLKKISDYLIRYLKKKKTDTRIDRIEIAMKFVQDIPYGVPSEYRTEKSKYGGYKHDDGVYAPIEVLIKGYGDCDSKTFLFVCILSYMINPDDIIFVKGKNHLLSAVKNTKEIVGGMYFNHEGGKYYICETAGPGRPMFGKKNTNLGESYLYPLEIK
jgi:hypothetical protein